jgi:hypothetical protein
MDENNNMGKFNAEIGKLFEAGMSGSIDYKTCMSKVARRVLDGYECDEILGNALMKAINYIHTQDVGMVCYLLMLRIIRLEDDLRVLRAELAKERIGRMNVGGDDNV